MTKSPGHQKWPDHTVRENRVGERMQVSVAGELIADSQDVIRVDEQGQPPRFYFPREDVDMDHLVNSDYESDCPFKGHARYFNLKAGHIQLKDAVWSYLEPYEEHADLQQRLAFYDDKMPEIEVKPASQIDSERPNEPTH
jgi:uncharacterized protein (DUF427 family)